jgi:hypothetical protein
MMTMIYEYLIIINITYNSIIFLLIKISLYVLIHLMTTDSILMMLRHQLLLLLIDPLSLQLIHKMIQMSIIALLNVLHSLFPLLPSGSYYRVLVPLI